MKSRTRVLHCAAAFSVLGGLLLTLATASMPALAQDGDAQARDLPRAIVVGDARYLFDRALDLDPANLTQVARGRGITVFAATDAPPFDRVYAGRGQGRNGLSRYLPEGTPDSVCAAEAAPASTVQAGDTNYAFAGLEPDLSENDLQEIGQAGDQPLLAVSADDLSELFIPSDAGLQRFVQLDENGVPPLLQNRLLFGNQAFGFAEDVTDQVDPGSLQRIGCDGPFPLSADAGAGSPYPRVYAEVAGRVLAFDQSGDAPDAPVIPLAGDAAPAEETVAAEETAPAETAVPEETAPPIETIDEGDDATEAPAETPAGEETVAPTDTPAGDETAPTETPALEETVAVETAPAETAVAEETAAPDETPADEAAQLAGGRPRGFPRQVAVADGRFLFDRMVLLDPTQLTEVEQRDQFTIYAATDGPPFDRVYVARQQDQGQLGRYLLEGTPDTACAAEQAQVGALTLDTTTYAFAGFEPDLTTDQLQPIAQAGDQTVYAANAAGPFDELFIPSNDGLQRFVALDAEGRPAILADGLPFAGQRYNFGGDATDQVDLNSLLRIGCAGPFPLVVPQGEEQQPYAQIYALVAGSVLRFDATGAADETAVPDGTATAIAPIDSSTLPRNRKPTR